MYICTCKLVFSEELKLCTCRLVFSDQLKRNLFTSTKVHSLCCELKKQIKAMINMHGNAHHLNVFSAKG